MTDTPAPTERTSALGRFVARRPAATATWAALLVAIPVVMGLRWYGARRGRAANEALPVLATLPAFTLTAQNGQPFGTTQLQGRVWVANFFFTACPSICPRLTEHMGRLQGMLAAEGDRVHLVSFSVDPRVDTPEVLRAYGQRYRVDFDRWHLLTGEAPDLQRVAQEGFLQATEVRSDDVPGRPRGYNILHSGNVVLVDARGRVRGYYRADEAGAAAVVEAARQLLREP
jgi:protein SCO1/2